MSVFCTGRTAVGINSCKHYKCVLVANKAVSLSLYAGLGCVYVLEEIVMSAND